MKVVILCGGRGARLREETEFRPKPMVTIGTKPILWHIMKHYAHYGFSQFVLCLGYKGEVIKEYFYHYMLHNNDVTIKLGQDRKITIHENSQAEDWEITLVDTGENTLKGARIHKIQKYVDDDFMLSAVDIVADPSAPNAFVEGIMEGKEWIWDNGILRESEVAKIERLASENKQLEAFEMFLSKL